ncbi:MAG: type II toxin-antitoxin system Phd/YefM family antitoxin [Gammaproteobacteria bacterium]
MKVSMVEINKEASSIVNQVSKTGESAIIYKHGKPIAEIRALTDHESSERDIAYRNLLHLQPARVDESIAEVIAKGRQRGI